MNHDQRPQREQKMQKPITTLNGPGLKLIQQEIERSLARDDSLILPHCARCRSQWLYPRAAVGPRGGMWRWDWCSDCELEQNYELDR